MQTQINTNTHAHRNTNVQRSIQSHHGKNDSISYREIHNSYKKREVGGIEDLRKVSTVPEGVDITCLLCYLNTQLGDDEKLTAERIAELSKTDLSEVQVADFG